MSICRPMFSHPCSFEMWFVGFCNIVKNRLSTCMWVLLFWLGALEWRAMGISIFYTRRIDWTRVGSYGQCSPLMVSNVELDWATYGYDLGLVMWLSNVWAFLEGLLLCINFVWPLFGGIFLGLGNLWVLSKLSLFLSNIWALFEGCWRYYGRGQFGRVMSILIKNIWKDKSNHLLDIRLSSADFRAWKS